MRNKKKTKRKITPLGIEIKKKLLDKHMTQTELAKRVGVTKVYITEIIYGTYNLKRSPTLEKILRELKIEPKNDDELKQ